MKQLETETHTLFSRPSPDSVIKELCVSPEGLLPTPQAVVLRSTLHEGGVWVLGSPSGIKAFLAVRLWTIYLTFLNFSFLHYSNAAQNVVHLHQNYQECLLKK